jgi:hypothetical protein
MDDRGVKRFHIRGIHFGQFVHVGKDAGTLLGHFFLSRGVRFQTGQTAEMQEILFIEGHVYSL